MGRLLNEAKMPRTIEPNCFNVWENIISFMFKIRVSFFSTLFLKLFKALNSALSYLNTVNSQPKYRQEKFILTLRQCIDSIQLNLISFSNKLIRLLSFISRAPVDHCQRLLAKSLNDFRHFERKIAKLWGLIKSSFLALTISNFKIVSFIAVYVFKRTFARLCTTKLWKLSWEKRAN